MSSLKKLKSALLSYENKDFKPLFFKTNVGDYSEHDKFMGISVPILKKLAKEFSLLSFKEVESLLHSLYNEERLLALLILIRKFENPELKEKVFCFLIANIEFVNNWNLVDCVAPLVIGSYLYDKDKHLLFELSKSRVLWERRIAIVATLFFIRHGELQPTLEIAQILISDTHDLIHKAVGWMLREVGKQDTDLLIMFLDNHYSSMPRTMLRYAIERLPSELRKEFLKRK